MRLSVLAFRVVLLGTVVLTMFSFAVAQTTGERPDPLDTLIVFTPIRPLIQLADERSFARTAVGGDVMFTASGWAMGVYAAKNLSPTITLLSHFAVAPRRHSDEFEDVLYGNIPVISGKKNRLFVMPLSFGVQYRLFEGMLQESFRPFLTAGVSPALIVATPYIRDGQYFEFFQSFGSATSFLRIGGFFGIGAHFGTLGKGPLLAAQIRYVAIPFGGEGIESMRNIFIKDVGGIMLSLTFGSSF
jgi:hypothetical protein